MPEVNSKVMSQWVDPNRMRAKENGYIYDKVLDKDWCPAEKEEMDLATATELFSGNEKSLPDAIEAFSLVIFAKFNPEVFNKLFPDNKTSGWYWTKTKVPGYAGYAYVVEFKYGSVDNDHQDGHFHVRPVRVSQ